MITALLTAWVIGIPVLLLFMKGAHCDREDISPPTADDAGRREVFGATNSQGREDVCERPAQVASATWASHFESMN